METLDVAFVSSQSIWFWRLSTFGIRWMDMRTRFSMETGFVANQFASPRFRLEIYLLMSMEHMSVEHSPSLQYWEQWIDNYRLIYCRCTLVKFWNSPLSMLLLLRYADCSVFLMFQHIISLQMAFNSDLKLLLASIHNWWFIDSVVNIYSHHNIASSSKIGIKLRDFDELLFWKSHGILKTLILCLMIFLVGVGQNY